METTLNVLHHQAIDWLRELDFYADEVTLLSGRLSTAALKNTRSDLKDNFDNYKKRFEDLAQRITNMKNDVHVREGAIENLTMENKGNDKVVSMDDDIILKEIKVLLHDIADARYLLNLFLANTIA